MDENHAWEWPDPTASEMRRFVERDCGKYLVNALRDVGATLGFMSFADECPPTLDWLDQAGELVIIPGEIEERLLRIAGSGAAARRVFPSLDRVQLDAARVDIVNVMMWLRAEFPAAGVEYLPDDFGS
jgi:hypothetical protein